VGAIVGAIAGGGVGAAGVAAGVALVIVSYVVSTLAIAWADSIAPRLVLPVGLATYLAKVSVFIVLIVVVLDSGWTGRVPMAVGIVVGAVAWTASQIWWTARHAYPNDRPYAFIPDPPAER
jgi:hypothetical protein